MSKGRRQEAEAILRKAARVNKVTLPDDLFVDEKEEEPEKAALWSLFTSRVLLVRTLIIFFNWYVGKPEEQYHRTTNKCLGEGEGRR